jgi:uncharacterized protein (TIGR03437 family)
MVRVALLFLLSCSLWAQISSVEIVGTTNVQAILRYQAPSDEPCSVEISDNSEFTSLVHDVNPSLFPNHNLDNRAGNISEGRNRTFVAGKRAVHQAADGKWYSRALQAETTHYYRIRCGDQTRGGSFRTTTVPVGIARPWQMPQDASGNFRWPSTDNDNRDQRIIDPNYGTLIRRITVPGDMTSLNFPRRRFSAADGGGWDQPLSALNDDGDSATAQAGAGWLSLTGTGITLTAVYLSASSVTSVIVTLKGSSPAESEADRTIEACLTIDGANCNSDIRTAVLDRSQRTITIGSNKRIDTWGQTLWQHDISNKFFGVLIRPKGSGPVSIQYAEISVAMDAMPGMSDSGNFHTCSPTKSNGGYHCSFPGSNGAGANYMYWINPDTAEVRWLGAIIATNWGGAARQCLSTNAPWDSRDPNIYFCAATLNNRFVLLKGTYRGNDQQASPNATANFEWQDLTPGRNTMTELIQAFEPSFDDTKFPCVLGNITGDYAVIGCYRAGQDSYAWIVVFDLGNREPVGAGGTGKVVAAVPSFATPTARWCGVHSFTPMTGVDWVAWTPKALNRNREGHGPFRVRLLSNLPASAGRMTVQVSGEPEPALMPVEPGDVFQLIGGSGFDSLRIVEKTSSTEWVVERTVLRGQPTATSGERELIAYCKAYLPDPSIAPAIYWNFLADLKAADTTNTRAVVEKVLTGGHTVQRGSYRLQAHWADGYQIVTPGAPKSWNRPISFKIPSNPRYNGVRAFIGLDERYQGVAAYQSHPSYENYLATAPRNTWFVDLIPFIGLPALNGPLSRVPGFQQVYQTKANLHRETFPTFGKCGGRMLRETIGPITDSDAYSFCVGMTCVNGAGPQDVFLNCPAPVSESSRCTEAFSGDAASVCISDLPPFGQSVSQLFFDRTGRKARVITNGLMPVHSPRTQTILDTASPLPDGSWVIFPAYANNARKDLYMVKVPSDPGVIINPDAGLMPVELTVEVRPPAGIDVADVVIQYGSSSLELVTAPVKCQAGGTCTVKVPGSHRDILYTRVVYRDASGTITGNERTEAHLSGGLKGAGFQATASRVRNAASLQNRIAPGGVATLLGEQLAPCEASTTEFPAPRDLCGSSVRVNNAKAPLFQVSPTEIKFQVPAETVPGQPLEIVAGLDDAPSDPIHVDPSDVVEAAPALYSYTIDEEVQRAIIWNPDSTLNGPPDKGVRALRSGEAAVLYANSLGTTDPQVPDGEAAPADPLPKVKHEVEVYINDVRQKVLYAGLTPGQVGVYQVNFVLDPATPVLPEDTNRIWLRVREEESAKLVISLEAAPSEASFLSTSITPKQ